MNNSLGESGASFSAPLFSSHPASEYTERVNERLTLIGRRDALRPGTDSLLLAGLLPYLPHGRALEIGCGNGAIALLAASREKFAAIDALEAEPILAELTARNIEKNRLGARVRGLLGDVREFTGEGARYDAILCNPPYRKAGCGRASDKPLLNAARLELRGGIADFCHAAARLMAPDGHFYLVYPAARRGDLDEALASAGLSLIRLITVHPHRGAPPSLLLAVAARAGECREERLYLWEDTANTRPTAAIETLYRTGYLPEGEEK